ncbi:MAG: hypothetical protein K0Q54_128 [Methylobacterium brachiatum]|jgi:hypothetical protein|nr:hypothetical protein [Methylobacterium brachiatum]
MNPVGSVTSNPSTALTLMQVDTSLKPRSGQEDAETDPTTLAATTALQVLDPRSAVTLSTQASDAILSVLHKIPHHKSVGGPAGIDESPMLSDEVFAQTLQNTPTADVEKMLGLGASRWVWRPEAHFMGEAFAKALAAALPNDYDKMDSMRRAIFDDRSAQITLASDVPEAKLVAGYYDMYDSKNKLIGTMRKTSCDQKYLDKYRTDNPGMLIAPVYFGNDAVLVMWPSSPSRT